MFHKSILHFVRNFASIRSILAKAFLILKPFAPIVYKLFYFSRQKNMNFTIKYWWKNLIKRHTTEYATLQRTFNFLLTINIVFDKFQYTDNVSCFLEEYFSCILVRWTLQCDVANLWFICHKFSFFYFWKITHLSCYSDIQSLGSVSKSSQNHCSRKFCKYFGIGIWDKIYLRRFKIDQLLILSTYYFIYFKREKIPLQNILPNELQKNCFWIENCVLINCINGISSDVAR